MTQINEKLPNFIIFGSTKSGSTSLCNYIVQHPEIFISEKKEPNFFVHEEDSQITSQSGHTTVYSLDWYKYWFRNASTKAIGEASVDYMASEDAPHRIKAKLPNVKLIAILREPVSRLYSHYLFHLRIQIGKGMKDQASVSGPDLLETLQMDREHGSPHQYFEKGLYYHYLKNYFDIFDHNQIKIFLFEDFTSNPLKVCQDVFDFLDVDSTFSPITTAKDATSGVPKSKYLYDFIVKDNALKKMIRPVVRAVIPNSEKRRALWTRSVSASLSRPTLDLDTKKAIAAMYRADITQLQDLIDRDLSKWLSIVPG